MRHVEVVHHVTRRHRPEVEVSPPRVELTFGDERAANPASSRARFEANVLNACSTEVRWEVLDPGGGPGAGSIDSTGLYTAPDFSAGLDGHTDVVVATLVEDPLRKAFAWVTLVGCGPWPVPVPTIQVTPKVDAVVANTSVRFAGMASFERTKNGLKPGFRPPPAQSRPS